MLERMMHATETHAREDSKADSDPGSDEKGASVEKHRGPTVASQGAADRHADELHDLASAAPALTEDSARVVAQDSACCVDRSMPAIEIEPSKPAQAEDVQELRTSEPTVHAINENSREESKAKLDPSSDEKTASPREEPPCETSSSAGPASPINSGSASPRRTSTWEVIGGGDTAGIIVRQGVDIHSFSLGRLATGSVISLINESGTRMNYKLVSGVGPKEGWISKEVKGKRMVRPAGL